MPVMLKKTRIAIGGTALLLAGTAAFVWYGRTKGARIVRMAKGFIGQKETGTNTGFANPVFQSMMYTLGAWRPGYEWCASFARMVWLVALKGKQRTVAEKLLDPSTQRTYSAFEKDRSGLFSVGQKPKPGSIVIWRSRSKPHKGHAGIYAGKIGGKHYFVEGNSKNAVRLNRYADYKNYSKDLYLRGFINW